MSDLLRSFGFGQGYKETSREAYKSSSERVSDMKKRILGLLEDAGANGLSDEEMDIRLGTEATRSNRPTRLALVEDGLVRDSGTRRATTSGSKAIVWVLTPEDEVDHQRSRMQVEAYRKTVKRKIGSLTLDQLKSVDRMIEGWEQGDSSASGYLDDEMFMGSVGYDPFTD